jgi:hypothetical protein
VVPQSANRRKDAQHAGATMTTATQHAGLATLLVLTTASPSFAQSRTADGYPSHYCLPTTVDSPDDQKIYCEGWRTFRKGW